MCGRRFTIASSSRQQVEDHLQTAQRLGHVRQVTYCLALLAMLDGHSVAQGAGGLRLQEKTVVNWVCACYCSGRDGVPHNTCLLYTSPSPRDGLLSRMPSSA